MLGAVDKQRAMKLAEELGGPHVPGPDLQKSVPDKRPYYNVSSDQPD